MFTTITTDILNFFIVEYPFLQGRAFVFASEFAKILPTEMASQYVSVAVHALQAPTSGIPVKISALRALNNYCKYLNPEYIYNYQVNIMEGTCLLLSNATEESLMLLLDTLGSAIKVNILYLFAMIDLYFSNRSIKK